MLIEYTVNTYKKVLFFYFLFFCTLRFIFTMTKPPNSIFNVLFLKKRILKNYARVYRDMGALIPYYEAELKKNHEEINRVNRNMETLYGLYKKEAGDD